jgi:eukaryotic-like serine/threonine-protein kinase
MTKPPDPFGPRPSGFDPFGGAAFGQMSTPPPPLLTGGPPPRPPTNTLATLSVIFAVVFAPAGALLGHLGLAQIRRTGQPGRERALIGLVSSYAVIAITVVAVTIWATTFSSGTTRAPRAAPSPSAASPAAPPSSGVHVAPADLAGLLPNATQIAALTYDYRLTLQFTVTDLAVRHREGVIDRPECEGLLVLGDARVYDTATVRGLYLTDYVDQVNGFALEAVQEVSAYDDAPAAQAAKDKLLAGWRACGGTQFSLNFNGIILNHAVTVPADAGHGITTATVAITNGVGFNARAIAAKANVVVDVLVGAKTDQTPVAVAITNAILAKIPDR